jgi:hypothetical protein
MGGTRAGGRTAEVASAVGLLWRFVELEAVKARGGVDNESLLALLCTSAHDWCVSWVEAIERGLVACRQSSDASDAAGGGEEEGEDGREWLRGRRVEVAGMVVVTVWERTAKGLAVWGREEGDEAGRCGGGDRRRERHWGGGRFGLVVGERHGWTDKVWIPVSTRTVWRETVVVEDVEEKEEDGADARERGGGRGAASDAGEGDECGEVTWVGRRGLGTGRESMGREAKGDIGRRGKGEGRSWREVWRTLLREATRWEWVREGENGVEKGEECTVGGPTCSRSADSWWMT